MNDDEIVYKYLDVVIKCFLGKNRFSSFGLLSFDPSVSINKAYYEQLDEMVIIGIVDMKTEFGYIGFTLTKRGENLFRFLLV